jgi:hypothetical protein
MASEQQQDKPDQQPRLRWDYSSHPLKAGGTQIVTVVVGTVLLLVFSVLLLLGIITFFFHPAAS